MDVYNFDVTVIGGGLSGVCSAIAAARENNKVCLIQDRSVLGGNSSSEIRVWICGAVGLGYNKYADETGIISEIALENLYRNKEGNPVIWDTILEEKVRDEDNISLYLNTSVTDVKSTNGYIKSVVAHQQASEKKFLFYSDFFIDCTGDGTIGFLAGAEFMWGREGQNQYNENLAPKIQDNITLGDSLLFYTKKCDRPVKYVPPKFAYTGDKIKGILESTSKKVSVDMKGCDYWWLEYGGNIGTIDNHDNIALELKRIVYGIWDYIKNSGEFDSENMDLEWVGSIPGKRESRRLKGQYVLNQNDIQNEIRFKDGVCHGGWPIDTHPEEGIYSKDSSCTQIPVNIYSIPLSVLCSCNIKNLLFAGRNASVSHVAFASSRVMKTCAVMGQAAGIAASVALKHNKSDNKFTEKQIKEIQQTLLKSGVYIIGEKNKDPKDKALKAKVSVSDTIKFGNSDKDLLLDLNEDVFITITGAKKIKNLSLYAKSKTGSQLKWEIYKTKHSLDYHTESLFKSGISEFQEDRSVFNIKCDILNKQKNNLIIKLSKNQNISLWCSKYERTGIFAVKENTKSHNIYTPCFHISPDINMYDKSNILNGYTRPYKGANLWASGNVSSSKQWIMLSLESVEDVNEVILFFNHNVMRAYNNILIGHYTKQWKNENGSMVKDFELLYLNKDREVIGKKSFSNNYQSRISVKQKFNDVKHVKVIINSTWGAAFGEIFEIRVY